MEFLKSDATVFVSFHQSSPISDSFFIFVSSFVSSFRETIYIKHAYIHRSPLYTFISFPHIYICICIDFHERIYAFWSSDFFFFRTTARNRHYAHKCLIRITFFKSTRNTKTDSKIKYQKFDH